MQRTSKFKIRVHAVFLSLSKKEHPLDKICSIRRTIVKKHCDSKYI